MCVCRLQVAPHILNGVETSASQTAEVIIVRPGPGDSCYPVPLMTPVAFMASDSIARFGLY